MKNAFNAATRDSGATKSNPVEVLGPPAPTARPNAPAVGPVSMGIPKATFELAISLAMNVLVVGTAKSASSNTGRAGTAETSWLVGAGAGERNVAAPGVLAAPMSFNHLSKSKSMVASLDKSAFPNCNTAAPSSLGPTSVMTARSRIPRQRNELTCGRVSQSQNE